MDWLSAVKDIMHAKENNQLVIFVGAGVSKNSNVPTWGELIKKFAGEIGYSKCDKCKCKCKDDKCPDPECENRYNFTQDEFLRIPEYYYQQFGKEKYYSLIRHELQGGTGPNPIDDEIIRLLPSHIITTNYDSLLEESKAEYTHLYKVVSRDSDLLSTSNDRYIVKMHGDFTNEDSIVLKESDYIDYEQKHPLISTFIKSLLINHTFLFLGYSLNDYNLNLIIGWINYYKKVHNVNERPNSYLISNESASSLEQARLADKNIEIVSLNEIPAETYKMIKDPKRMENSLGIKLYKFLKFITDKDVYNNSDSIEKILLAKYRDLEVYDRISCFDLIKVFPLGRTVFMGSTLVFYEDEWFEKIKSLLVNADSPIAKIFCKSGITHISKYGTNENISVPGIDYSIDEIWRSYLDNDYLKLNAKIDKLTSIPMKITFSSILNKDKEAINLMLKTICDENPIDDYAKAVLYKTRERINKISFLNREEELTTELISLINQLPERWKKATGSLRLVLDLSSNNMHEMQTILEKHEERYEYKNNTFYSEGSHVNLAKLQAYVYDYYSFFMENGIALHHFSEPKDYFSFYLRAILCTYSPVKERGDSIWGMAYNPPEKYILSELDIELFTKFVQSKKLRAWIKRYSVQEIEVDESIDIAKKFVNLCNSAKYFNIPIWTEQIHSLAILICLVRMQDVHKCAVVGSLCTLIDNWYTNKNGDIFELTKILEYLIVNLNIGNSKEIFEKVVYCILKTYDKWTEKYLISNIMRKICTFLDEQIKQRIVDKIESIADVHSKINMFYTMRYAIEKEKCRLFFEENYLQLSCVQIFHLLVEGIINPRNRYGEHCISLVKKAVEDIEKNNGIRSYPDKLNTLIEYCILIKICGFYIDIEQLKDYMGHSVFLEFIVNPNEFDYSKVDTTNYMWNNLIYSKEYQHFFIEHRHEILTDKLKKIFSMNVETKEQRKVVYGILLPEDELRTY